MSVLHIQACVSAMLSSATRNMLALVPRSSPLLPPPAVTLPLLPMLLVLSVLSVLFLYYFIPFFRAPFKASYVFAYAGTPGMAKCATMRVGRRPDY
jgi:hypothetical protein